MEETRARNMPYGSLCLAHFLQAASIASSRLTGVIV
jgi:hypothetical protein